MKSAWSAAAVLSTLAIVGISAMPAGTMGGTGSTTEQVVSNLLHIPAFAVLTFLWIKAFQLEDAGWKSENKRALAWLLAGLVCFGALSEFQQSFVPGRFASFMDFVFNLIGILVGWWGTKKVYGLGRSR